MFFLSKIEYNKYWFGKKWNHLEKMCDIKSNIRKIVMTKSEIYLKGFYDKNQFEKIVVAKSEIYFEGFY